MDNKINKIIRVCKNCNICKDIENFNSNKTKNCKSKKHICKDCEEVKNNKYFKKYYNDKVKINHPLKRGRPKKELNFEPFDENFILKIEIKKV